MIDDGQQVFTKGNIYQVKGFDSITNCHILTNDMKEDHLIDDNTMLIHFKPI